jgi:cation diffusion facilitator CzcD-associated flavoprotein CzcO
MSNEHALNEHAVNEAYDAIVIGAGFTGMYQLYTLRKMGLKVKGYDIAGDIGGTWYWNRYPGCRVDTESYVYCYAFSEEILKEWSWSEQFAGQPEVLRYLDFAAQKMDIRRSYQFNTRVNRAVYDEASGRWTVNLSDGSTVTTKWLISATGPLSAPQMPAYKGVDSFKGESFHSYFWPRDPEGGTAGRKVDYRGKRVGVIGTGATGVQIITEVAKEAGELYVFQRTPNWCTPLRNSPLSAERTQEIKSDYQSLLDFCKSTLTSFPYNFRSESALEVDPKEREAVFEKLYNTPGYGIWFGNYHDIITDKRANQLISDFIANKIRQRVKDPAVAEKLIPKNHGFGTKRVPMESGYFEVYNQPNVHLVDIREAPIEAITEKGVKTTAHEYELDILIYATGFDAVTGALDRMEIVGKGGRTLKDTWADGPLTYLGLQIVGFPNFFTLVAAHNGASFCNIPICGQLQVEWMNGMFRYMLDRKIDQVEATPEAEEKWTEEVHRLIHKTLFAEVDSWFLGVNRNVAGKDTRRVMVYAGGGVRYRETCARVAANDYEGFSFR